MWKEYEEAKPVKKNVTETVFASGALEAKETYKLTSLADGYLTDISFKENDFVKQGQILAVIDNKQSLLNTENAQVLYDISKSNASPDSPMLLKAKNAVDMAKSKLEFDEKQFDRYKILFEANSISKADYEKTALQYQNSKSEYQVALENYNIQKQQVEQQLSINKTQKNVTKVLAAFNEIKAVKGGRIYKKYKEEGDFVRQGEVIATIGDANIIYAKVSVDEGSIAKIKVGQEAIIQLNIDKNKLYKGEVAEILPTFDETTQSFICKIYFLDSLDFKITSTQLQVNITVGSTKNALLIPRNYLSYGNEVTIKGSKTPIKIETKFVSSEWVQVISGIDENTVLVTDNIKK
ncbi:MAG: HlyD family efflux transporter periplasmic adaptor subunit [Bacteroidales bacterium]|nr:HlyD family efflux transporter periplasmic adaptor subunit [Bacteroidales bacterium]